MKKATAFALAALLILGLASCVRETPPDGPQSGQTAGPGETEGPGTDVPEIPFTPPADPRGKTLQDTSDGVPAPQRVDTLYETDDVVIADFIPTEMGYAVDPTGLTDSTAGLQKALYDCYNAGGGTVWLPAGHYAVSGTVYIPPFCTLQGDWQDPDTGNEYGTVIAVWMDPEESETSGTFLLGGSAGAVGLTVYYPEQSLDRIAPYPYTFYVDGEGQNLMLSTVKNVTILNGYRGIGTSSVKQHEMLQLINVKGTFLQCGVGISNSADVGTVTNLAISNDYWKNASTDYVAPVDGDKLDYYTAKNTTGLQIGDLEWTTFRNISIRDCAIGIHTVPGVRIEYAGAMYRLDIRDCVRGFVADGLDTRWGGVIADGYIEGGIANNTEGRLKLCGVEVVGGITEKVEGHVIIDDTDLSAYDAPEESFVKPVDKVVIAELSKSIFADASEELQPILDKVGSEGGGVVYVPGGNYRFRGRLTVPAGVELRGSSGVQQRDNGTVNNGTVFLCYYGDDPENGPEDPAFITLAGENAGISGIRVIYPENSPNEENLNTTYAIRGEAAGVYVRNCAVSAAQYGIDMRGCDRHLVSGVVTCCYENSFRLGGEGGLLTRCLQNGTVIERTKVPGLQNWLRSEDLFSVLMDPILRDTCEYIIVDGASNQVIRDVFAYAAQIFVTNLDSTGTVLVNIGADNIGTVAPMVNMDGGSLTGVNLMRYNGYSYELINGELKLYNRIAINEVGEKSVEKSS